MFKSVISENSIKRNLIVVLACCLFLSTSITYSADSFALAFNGTDDYVDIGPWPELSSEVMTHPVTFECWISSENTAATMTLMGAVNTADSMFFRISLNKDGMRGDAAWWHQNSAKGRQRCFLSRRNRIQFRYGDHQWRMASYGTRV